MSTNPCPGSSLWKVLKIKECRCRGMIGRTSITDFQSELRVGHVVTLFLPGGLSAVSGGGRDCVPPNLVRADGGHPQSSVRGTTVDLGSGRPE